MPIYEFRCPRCGKKMERLFLSPRKYEEKEAPNCPICGTKMNKIPSLVAKAINAPTDAGDEENWKRVHSYELEAKRYLKEGKRVAASRTYEEAAKRTEETGSDFSRVAKRKFLTKAREVWPSS
ncbi:MAG: zinc ribbon domain-containing protein [Chloroflexota bacterium]|nr:zinc ribbon domain-containing protein [Chloroflexota bacterium]